MDSAADGKVTKEIHRCIISSTSINYLRTNPITYDSFCTSSDIYILYYNSVGKVYVKRSWYIIISCHYSQHDKYSLKGNLWLLIWSSSRYSCKDLNVINELLVKPHQFCQARSLIIFKELNFNHACDQTAKNMVVLHLQHHNVSSVSGREYHPSHK